jgi:hypothetical protein
VYDINQKDTIMMGWLHKWGYGEQVPIDDVYNRLAILEQKYSGALQDIKRLEEENIETTNLLYEIINSTEAIDRRIDIVFEELTK